MDPQPEGSLAETLKVHFSEMSPPKIQYFGCATSHFQAEPVLHEKDGSRVAPASDWEHELDKNLKGLKSGIAIKQSEEELPRLLDKFQQYTDRSAALGNNMFRFSFDFARLCPSAGNFNSGLMRRYVRALATVRQSGQEPMLTMHHFTMPKYLVRIDADGNITNGAWEHPDVLTHFRFYLKSVMEFLGNKDAVRAALMEGQFSADTVARVIDEGAARYFLSINEPAITPLNGYISGIFPPYNKLSVFTARKILDKILTAHDICRDEIRGLGSKLPPDRQPQLGVGYNWQYYDGALGAVTHKYMDRRYTDRFERDGSFSDFLGLHYYYRQTMPFFSKRWRGRVYSDMPTFGDVYPSGIQSVLKKLHKAYPSKPIFVSEVGFSDSSDLRRPYWILQTLDYVVRAHAEGINISGILLWSLVNNFEWDMGMSQKFGLFDEAGLSQPLTEDSGRIRSWEAWKIGTHAIRNPSQDSLQRLQNALERARAQHKKAIAEAV